MPVPLSGPVQLTLTAGRAALQAASVAWGAIRPRFVQPAARRRIGLQAYAVHQAQFYEPIVARLRETSGVELCFIVLPHPQFAARERRRLREIAVQRFGLPPDRVVSYAESLWWPFDLVFYTDTFAAFPLRPARNCLVPHGVALSGREFARRWPRKRVCDFDLVLPAGPHDRDLIEAERRRLGSTAEVHAVGCPFLDGLLGATEGRTAYFERLGLDAALPAVVLAPHWRDLLAWSGGGVETLRAVVDALASVPLNVIIKLHAMCYVPAVMDGRRWSAVLRRFERPRVAVDPDADDRPALRHGDVLVTGRSSRAFNFMLLDKPVVLFPAPSGAGDAHTTLRAELLRGACSLAADVPELVQRVREALEAPETLSPARRRRADALFANPGRATDALMAVLFPEYGVEHPLPATG